MWFDPSMLVLFAFAITCIIYGAVKSHTFMRDSNRTNNTDVVDESSSIKLRNIIIFVVVGSVFLLLLFYLFNIIYYLLLIFIIIVSFISLFIVGAPLIDLAFDKAGFTDSAIRGVPIFRTIKYSFIALVLASFSIIVAWIVTGHWLVVNLLAWSIGVTQMSVIRLPNLKLSVILLGLFLLYDVFWVFISPFFWGESVMVAVAMKMPATSLPLTLSMPHILEKQAYSLMGLGDIVLPGLFICFTYNFDEALKYLALYGAPSDLNDNSSGIRAGRVAYFPIALVGYSSGFMLTIIVAGIMNQGQPALLYLVPGVLIPTIAAAHLQGHLGLMWSGPPANIIPPTPSGDEEQALVSMNDEEGQQLEEHPSPQLALTTTKFATTISTAPTQVVFGPFATASEPIVAPNISAADVAGSSSSGSSGGGVDDVTGSGAAVLTTAPELAVPTSAKIDGADIVEERE